MRHGLFLLLAVLVVSTPAPASGQTFYKLRRATARFMDKLDRYRLGLRAGKIERKLIHEAGTVFYRALHPTFVSDKRNGVFYINGNPDPGSRIADPYNGQHDRVWPARILETPGLGVTNAKTTAYSSKGWLIAKIKLGDVHRLGGKLYPSDQGNWFVTLPKDVPVKIVKGSIAHAEIGAAYNRKRKACGAVRLNANKWEHGSDGAFEAVLQSGRPGSWLLDRVRYKIDGKTLTLLRSKTVPMDPGSTKLQAVVLGLLAEHQDVTQYRIGGGELRQIAPLLK